jgi:4-hydroxy-tetrahydrodipicolinate reductase
MTGKLAIVGMGKMGRAIAEMADARGWTVVATLGRGDVAAGITSALLNEADVAIEFTTPDAVVSNVQQIVAAGVPVVVGTTGWYDDFAAVTREVEARNGAILTATNFSLGVNIFIQLAATAARLLSKAPRFDAHIVETHHAAKKDAPSGTAITLQQAASAEWGSPIPITSVRTGSVPGTHEFIFDSPFEQIHLEHIARDRRVFAEGALVAAGWLIGKHGVFSMRDVLETSTHGSSS